MVAYAPVNKTQTLVQLTSDLLAVLDQRSTATGRSRSDIIREAIKRYFEDDLEDEIDRRIVAGYRSKPQGDDRLSEASAIEAIAEEPW